MTDNYNLWYPHIVVIIKTPAFNTIQSRVLLYSIVSYNIQHTTQQMQAYIIDQILKSYNCNIRYPTPHPHEQVMGFL